MGRRRFLSFSAAWVFGTSASAQNVERPNVVLIVADNMAPRTRHGVDGHGGTDALTRPPAAHPRSC